MTNTGNFFLTFIGILIGLLLISIPAIIIVLIWKLLRRVMSAGWTAFVFLLIFLILSWVLFSQARKLSSMVSANKEYINEMISKYNTVY